MILGAGLDTFAQRHPELGARLRVFEIDQPATQAWKAQRLGELGLGVPPFLRFVPVDFEQGDSWRKCLAASGFDATRPAIVASTGVSMYLSKEAVVPPCEMSRRSRGGRRSSCRSCCRSSSPSLGCDPGSRRAARGARASGTPWLSFFTPAEMLALARDAGFRDVEHVSADALTARYFAGRTDGIRLPSNSEELLVATV